MTDTPDSPVFPVPLASLIFSVPSEAPHSPVDPPQPLDSALSALVLSPHPQPLLLESAAGASPHAPPVDVDDSLPFAFEASAHGLLSGSAQLLPLFALALGGSDHEEPASPQPDDEASHPDRVEVGGAPHPADDEVPPRPPAPPPFFCDE
jgi:hypothetical protein